MNILLKYLIFNVALFFSSITYGQVDGSNGSRKKEISGASFNLSNEKIEKPKSLDFKDDIGFKTAHKKQQEQFRKKNEEEKSLKKGILTPEIRRKIVTQKKMEQYNIKIPQSDLDLGSFHTTSSKININALDFGAIDGDKVSVYRNGELIIKSYTLQQYTHTLKVPLVIGINRIEIVAINEGRLVPNTGAFTLFDDSNEIALSNMWNLAKGAKVIAVIIRDEKK
ncbi:hypothetical protein [Tenacibaculum sp. C7A-26P2]|uniref:hypothetical protein n=1 Tax=Tenacibaculum sp. C7A-26P2 TaxID=3447504 RepID=UPI003F825FF1